MTDQGELLHVLTIVCSAIEQLDHEGIAPGLALSVHSLGSSAFGDDQVRVTVTMTEEGVAQLLTHLHDLSVEPWTIDRATGHAGLITLWLTP